MPELPGLGYVANVGGRRRLVDGERLLDRWTKPMRAPFGPSCSSVDTGATWVRSKGHAVAGGVLIGGELAAARLTRHLRPGTATFYVQALDPKALLKLVLKADTEGNVDFRRRFWAFPTEETQLTPNLLVYADPGNQGRPVSRPLSFSVARSSLDLSDRAVLRPLAELLAAVRAAAGDASLLLIGAAARDILLVHAHGINPERATEDTDVALAVGSWGEFQRLREALLRSGEFSAGGPPHRLSAWRSTPGHRPLWRRGAIGPEHRMAHRGRRGHERRRSC
jgi:hypothetical protein